MVEVVGIVVLVVVVIVQLDAQFRYLGFCSSVNGLWLDNWYRYVLVSETPLMYG